MSELPSEKLKRGWTWKTWTGLGAAVAVVAAVGTAALITGPLGAPAPTTTSTYVVPHTASCDAFRGGQCVTPEQQAAADKQEQQLEADQAAQAAAAAAAAQAAAEQQAAEQQAAGPVRCPAGSRAGAVDGNGNESNCYAENASGQTCQAYNDSNECTAWGALDVKPLRP